jgi:hypothetical protein
MILSVLDLTRLYLSSLLSIRNKREDEGGNRSQS